MRVVVDNFPAGPRECLFYNFQEDICTLTNTPCQLATSTHNYTCDYLVSHFELFTLYFDYERTTLDKFSNGY